ncbi:uncharacterized protein LOC125314473 [Rhodamnia argentea]|uniref:Uncharacterized protein LOC125314473 n=1 Tax=Rhodamnia argentea TaxID=178133 RepID=A0ABM3H863_9MYRT|nr:uncharacterized protein LOC125314473 [Rhodamnia argentea]
MWNHKVTVEIRECMENFIDLICKDLESGTRMRMTFLHALTNFQETLCLWDILRFISTINSMPWICVRDFNKILFHWEKIGKREEENYRMGAFRELLADCSLMKGESKDCAFTWSNNRKGEALVKKRLDRVLCNSEWRVLFLNAEAYALPAIGSNHSQIILSTSPAWKRSRKELKFEAFWLEDPECSKIVKDVWGDQQDSELNFMDKTQKVTLALTSWSRRKFSNASKQI